MSFSHEVIERFFSPLNDKLRVRLKSNSFWDDFIPHRKLSELTEHVRDLDPDKLIYSVALGADRLTARFDIQEGSATYRGLEALMDRTRQRAERLKPVWRGFMSLIENTPQRARIKAFGETANFVLNGDVTFGAALQELFYSLADTDEVDDTARNGSIFFASIDAFLDGVMADFENLVMWPIVNEHGRN